MLVSNTDDIIARLKLQDPAAIEVVFSAYKGYARHYYMKNYSRQYGNLHIDDVKQLCLISLLEKGPKFRGFSKPQLDAFTKKMFRNNIDNYMRSFVKTRAVTAVSGGVYELPLYDRIAAASHSSTENAALENVVFENLLHKHIIPSLDDKELVLFNALMDGKDLTHIRESENISGDAFRQRKCRLRSKVRALMNTPEAIRIYKS
jgi:DNA-directed RNA polymerase specialized sigma24 family protein